MITCNCLHRCPIYIVSFFISVVCIGSLNRLTTLTYFLFVKLLERSGISVYFGFEQYLGRSYKNVMSDFVLLTDLHFFILVISYFVSPHLQFNQLLFVPACHKMKQRFNPFCNPPHSNWLAECPCLQGLATYFTKCRRQSLEDIFSSFDSEFQMTN